MLEAEDTEHDSNEVNCFQRTKVNIRGKLFEISTCTLKKIPNTRLSALDTDSQYFDTANDEYFFDRDPDVFNSILNLYVYGKLHIPKHVCGAVMREEMKFWKISHQSVSECCLKTFYQLDDDQGMISEINKSYEYSDMLLENKEDDWRVKAWIFLDQPGSSLKAKCWHGFYMVVLLMSCVVYCLSTMPSLRTTLYLSSLTPEDYTFIHGNASMKFKRLLLTDPSPVLFAIETFCLLVFTVEWMIRFSFCHRKVKFLKRPLNVLNVFFVICMWIAFALEFVKGHLAENEFTRELYFVCKAVNMIRLVLFIRLEKLVSALRVLIMTVKGSLEELFLLLISFAMAVMIFSTLIYYAEIHKDDGLDSILICMWWSIITMTTVGYGDYYPTTTMGYLTGVLTSISGLLLLAMPIAVIVSTFSEYYTHQKNRDRYILGMKTELDNNKLQSSTGSLNRTRQSR